MRRGVKYDRNGLCARISLELAAYTEARCVGQIDVKQDSVGVVGDG
jgi:hypothetical protein